MVGSLTNKELDSYLRKKVIGVVIIPAQSYQTLFSYDGNIKDDDFKTALSSMNPCACCVNTDRADGPGLHWVAIIVFPRQRLLFYYDSLLPNKEYKISHEIAMFLNKMAYKGYSVYQNNRVDQKDTFKMRNQTRVYNDMCGVYAVEMIVMLDQALKTGKNLVQTFHEAHEKLRDSGFIYSLYLQIAGRA